MLGFEGIGKLLVIMGGLIVLTGLALMFARRIPYLGRLPGDIFVQRDSITVFAPIVTMIILSIVLTILLNIVFRIFR